MVFANNERLGKNIKDSDQNLLVDKQQKKADEDYDETIMTEEND